MQALKRIGFTTLESLTCSHRKYLQKLYKAMYKKNQKKLWSPITPHPCHTHRTSNRTQGKHTYQRAQNLKKRGINRGELTGSVQQ